MNIKSALFIAVLLQSAYTIPKEPELIATYTECSAHGSRANYSGYLSLSKDFQCKQGIVRIEGKWGSEIQNGYEYHTEFGDQTSSSYVGYLPLNQQMPKFQKWCKTTYGYSLCGWNQDAIDDDLAIEREHPAPPMKKGK